MANAAITRAYELTYLLPVSLTDSEANKAKEAIGALVKKFKGSIVETQEWGKRRLAYRIKHGGANHTDAIYVHQVLKFDPTVVPAFEREVYLNTTLLRHLLVIAEDKKPAPAPVAKAAESEVEDAA